MTLFSLASAVTAAAPSAAVFGGARLIAGLGLGGLLPTAIAYVMDYARPNRRNLMVGVVMTAHQTGGIVAAALGLWVVPSLGWRSVFWLGAVPIVIVVPLAFMLLPESVGFLLAKGRQDEAETLARRYGLTLETSAAGTTPPSRVPGRTSGPCSPAPSGRPRSASGPPRSPVCCWFTA